jgi:diamine N-acetyltransferase
MPEIRPVTKDNWQELIKLKVRDDQKHFVASNLYSIAQVQFGDEYEGHWNLHAFGIYEGDTPVGFFMYGYDFEHPKQQAFIFRLMVDEKYQGKVFRADERITYVGISYEPENDVARKLYAGFGFMETGEILGEETLAVLKIQS